MGRRSPSLPPHHLYLRCPCAPAASSLDAVAFFWRKSLFRFTLLCQSASLYFCLVNHACALRIWTLLVSSPYQVPADAEYPQALDLVRRILVSQPGQRSKMPDIMAHSWFQEKLPPGALLLNAAYLSMEHPVGESTVLECSKGSATTVKMVGKAPAG